MCPHKHSHTTNTEIHTHLYTHTHTHMFTHCVLRSLNTQSCLSSLCILYRGRGGEEGSKVSRPPPRNTAAHCPGYQVPRRGRLPESSPWEPQSRADPLPRLLSPDISGVGLSSCPYPRHPHHPMSWCSLMYSWSSKRLPCVRMSLSSSGAGCPLGSPRPGQIALCRDPP